MKVHFSKYQGTGNDFIIVDDRQNEFNTADQTLIAHLCHRRFGIGADGLILLRNHLQHDFEMIYFNADGKEGSMCGNGGRCIVQFAYDNYIINEDTTFMAVDGLHHAKIENNLVCLKMIDVADYKNNNGYYFMNTGSPHYVEFVEDLQNYAVYEKGKTIRYSQDFAPNGTNVNFVEKNKTGIAVRTYERGVEDETLACGTGATACALAHGLNGASSPIDIDVLGGKLAVSFDKTTTGFENIYLTGPAKKVFEGEYSL
jgi:diaminopimelate epimerase